MNVELSEIVCALDDIKTAMGSNDGWIQNLIIALVSVASGVFLSEFKTLFNRININVWNRSVICRGNKDPGSKIGNRAIFAVGDQIKMKDVENRKSALRAIEKIEVKLKIDIINNMQKRKNIQFLGIALKRNNKLIEIDIYEIDMDKDKLFEARYISIEANSIVSLGLISIIEKDLPLTEKEIKKLRLYYKIGNGCNRSVDLGIGKLIKHSSSQDGSTSN